MDHFDLMVVGGGAGGLAAAREAIRQDSTVVLITDEPPGGDCTFYGCVPSKSLIESAQAGRSFAEAFERMHQTIAQIASTESPGTLEREGIKVITGRARFISPNEIAVNNETLHGKKVIIATGSKPFLPPVDGLSGVDFLTNETVFNLSEKPSSMIIIGGGPIGCELAQALSRLGVTVKILEGDRRLLPREEPEASDVVMRSLHRASVEVIVNDKLERVSKEGDQIAVHTQGGRKELAATILVAVGRRPSTEGLGLTEAGVTLAKGGHIQTDKYLQTTASEVYACGDVTGKLPFTHVADEMGRLAAKNALGPKNKRRPFSSRAIPWVTFTTPEVARVGISEAEAPRNSRVAFLPLDVVDRAIISGETDGFVKLIAGPRPLLGNLAGGRLLGATVVAPRAGEMIHQVSMAMNAKMFTGRLAQGVAAYPTWSVAIRQAAALFFHEQNGHKARPPKR